ncbi:unnamed protein product [Schistocephalus solidus]|uniref:Uncharacterized protein n=1 Tax=Schistocephalus solidus TaxID=70667 RepID=A0A183TQT9_SCHSO|nr:unnamed protein product [Schistocephalus solidus]
MPKGVDATRLKAKVGRLDMHEFEVCVEFWKSLLRRQQCIGVGKIRPSAISLADQNVLPAARTEESTVLKGIALDDPEKAMRCQLEEIREGIEDLLRRRRRSRRKQFKQ